MDAQVSVARWKLNKSQVFAGQPIIISLRVFFSEQPPGNSIELEAISEDVDNHFRKLGFLIAVENQVEKASIEKSGDVYSALIWRGAIFQPDSGTFMFGQDLSLNAYLQRDSLEDKQQISIRFVPKPVKIDDLPETVLPKAWSVGNFTVSYELNKNRYLSGEPIQLKLIFKGQGGLASIPPPQIPVQDKFLVYDPRSEIKLALINDELIGEKEFTYELAGAFQGDYNIGPINFYFFNPQKYRFDSLSIQNLPVKIVGKDIPQLVQVNALDNFYRDALEGASREQKIPFYFASLLIWIATAILSALLLYGFLLEIKKRR